MVVLILQSEGRYYRQQRQQYFCYQLFKPFLTMNSDDFRLPFNSLHYRMDYNPEGLTLSILGCIIVRAKYFKIQRNGDEALGVCTKNEIVCRSFN